MLLLCSIVNAQQIWYFGQGAGIKFPTTGGGLPTAYGSYTTNPIKTYEGCAMAYDATGNVLMSTNGSYVYDKTNTAMPNGNGDIMGGGSATQSAVIVPVPGCNCNKYFVFTVASLSDGTSADTIKEQKGLRYSVVDMNLNGTKGDVINATKNTALVSTSLPNGSKFQGYSSEKLTACKDGKGGYWVIAHGIDRGVFNDNQKRFYAFHVTPSSIGSCNNPTIDTTNAFCKTTDIGNIIKGAAVVGQMKISSTGSKLAYATWGANTVELFDFNITTGLINNHQSFGSFDSQTYGIEFSPNERFLYVTACYGGTTNNIYQLDLFSTSIFYSKISIHSVTSETTYNYCSLQQWTDGRIYASNYNDQKIGVIDKPNSLGLLADYTHNAISLPSGTDSYLSLPTFIQDFTSCADPCNKCHNVSFYFNGKSYVMRKDTTIKIGCNNSFDFNPSNGCSTQDNVPVLGVSVKDAANNTPAWASTFIESNGNGSLNPANASGTYNLTYYFGTINPTNNKKDTCDKIVITINDTCISKPPSDCPCGEWVSIGYTLNNKPNKFLCSNGTALPLDLNKGDVITLSPNYRCFGGVVGAICEATFKYDIYFANGGKKLGVTDIKNLKIDSCGLIRVVMKAYCSGIECGKPCEFTINVACCTCSQTLSPMLYWNEGKDSSSLQCGSTVTNMLECYKKYFIKVKNTCGDKCAPDSVITRIIYPNKDTSYNYSLDAADLSVAALTGNYTVSIKVKCGGKWCDECKIIFKQTKPCQPVCDNCTDKVNAILNAGSSSVVVKPHLLSSTLNAALLLSGGTDTYTQLRINVTDIQVTSDNPACMQCYNSANAWGSIIAGSLSVSGFTATSTTFGTVATTIPYNNSREIVFDAATPTTLPTGTAVNLTIKIPGVNPISCCNLKIKLFLKVTYRNNKCEECTKIIAIDVTENPDGTGTVSSGTSGGTSTYKVSSPTSM